MGDNKDNEISSSILSWLHGVWESEEAEVMYPTMETIKYYEKAEFTPVSNILIDYHAQMWNVETKDKMHTEKGFIKVSPKPESKDRIAMIVAHNFGLGEVSEGTVNGTHLHLEAESESLNWMSFTPLTKTLKVTRDIYLEDDTLHQIVLMETIRTKETQHLRVKYKRKDMNTVTQQ